MKETLTKLARLRPSIETGIYILIGVIVAAVADYVTGGNATLTGAILVIEGAAKNYVTSYARSVVAPFFLSGGAVVNDPPQPDPDPAHDAGAVTLDHAADNVIPFRRRDAA